MRWISISAGEVTYPVVAVPDRFGERLRGMKAVTPAMLLAGRSVHGFGMDRWLAVVGVGEHDRVVAVRTLRPNRLVSIRGARAVLELESHLALPAVGDRVRFYDRVDGGTSRGVRHTDRQPRRRLRAARPDAPRG